MDNSLKPSEFNPQQLAAELGESRYLNISSEIKLCYIDTIHRFISDSKKNPIDAASELLERIYSTSRRNDLIRSTFIDESNPTLVMLNTTKARLKEAENIARIDELIGNLIETFMYRHKIIPIWIFFEALQSYEHHNFTEDAMKLIHRSVINK